MTYQSYSRSRRKRLSTSGSYHSAVEDSDYENDVGEELEEEEGEGLVVPKKTFSDDPKINRDIKHRPFFTIAFLLGVVFALGTVLVIENIKNGFYHSHPKHFELLPHLHFRIGIILFKL